MASDPQQVLKDLQQLAAVARKLGIDLEKVSAMGQQVGGKAQPGTPQVGAQNRSHQAYHEGAGTGYSNLAAGAVAGSSMSARLSDRRMVFQSREDRRLEMMQLAGIKPIPGLPNVKVLGLKLTEKRYGIDSPQYAKMKERYFREAAEEELAKKNLPSKIRPKQMSIMGHRAIIGAAGVALSIHNMGNMYGALIDEVDENAGETRTTKVVESMLPMASGMAGVSAGSALLTGIQTFGIKKVAAGFRAARAVGIGRAARLARAGAGIGRGAMAAIGSAGPQIVAYLAVEAAVQTVSTVIDEYKFANRSKRQVAEYVRKQRGPQESMRLHGGYESIEGLEYVKLAKPVDEKIVEKWNDIARQKARDYYIDSDGRRQKRNIIARFARHVDAEIGAAGWAMAPLFKLYAWARGWGYAKETEEMRKFDQKKATEAHEVAVKRSAVMDWRGAIEKVEEAKKLQTIEETQPFFWKQPEKWLRNMEAARMASRNWARSMQPRGADRTGD